MLTLFCALQPALSSGGLVLVASGESAYVVATAEDADPERVSDAVDLLVSAIAESTGVTLPVMAESEVSPGTSAIYLGRSQAARNAGIDVDDIQGWSYLNRVVDKDIFLVGEDAPGDGRTDSEGFAGPLKAVTAFLEQQVGVRFLQPGPNGRHIPRHTRVVIDAGMDVSWTPPFRYLAGRRVFSRMPGDVAYAVANNFFGRTGVFRQYGGHSYYSAVPASQYGSTNPEYFVLRNGVRDPEGNHLCISNRDVQELMLNELERAFDEGYEMAELSQTDGYRECQCEPCQAIHPDIGEKIWIVHRKLAEEMSRRRPGKKVVLLSYVWTIPPPRTFDRFPENVVIQTNRYVPEYFRLWAPFEVPMAVYLGNWLRFMPRIAPRYAVDQVRLFLENDVQGIYIMGGLDCGSGSPWGLNAPSYYAFGKAMENPARDADQLEEEYIRAAFGEVATHMLTFFRAMHRRLEAYAQLDKREIGLPDRRHRGYGFNQIPGDFFCHFYPPAMLNIMSANLGRARAQAQDPKVIARLEQVEAEFRFLRSVAMVLHVYRAYQAAPSWAAFELVAEQVRQYQETVQWLMPDGRMRTMQGLRPPFNGRNVATARKTIVLEPPFTWDFEEIRRQGTLPRHTVSHRSLIGRVGLPQYRAGGLLHDEFRSSADHEIVIEE